MNRPYQTFLLLKYNKLQDHTHPKLHKIKFFRAAKRYKKVLSHPLSNPKRIIIAQSSFKLGLSISIKQQIN
jgi:hypothetical protein